MFLSNSIYSLLIYATFKVIREQYYIDKISLTKQRNVLRAVVEHSLYFEKKYFGAK